MANRLTGSLRAEDTVARLGGDEFVIMLPVIESRAYSTVVADKILSRISAPYVIDGAQIAIGTSIGLAVYPDDGHECDALLKCADARL